MNPSFLVAALGLGAATTLLAPLPHQEARSAELRPARVRVAMSGPVVRVSAGSGVAFSPATASGTCVECLHDALQEKMGDVQDEVEDALESEIEALEQRLEELRDQLLERREQLEEGREQTQQELQDRRYSIQDAYE